MYEKHKQQTKQQIELLRSNTPELSAVL